MFSTIRINPLTSITSRRDCSINTTHNISTNHHREISLNSNSNEELPWKSIQFNFEVHSNPKKYKTNEPRFSFRSIKKSQQLMAEKIPKTKSHNVINLSTIPESKNIITVRSGSIFKFLSYPAIMSLLVLITLVIVDQRTMKPSIWQPGTRQLKGRKCVLNFFIENYQKDEFNPDYGVDHKEGENIVDGTHWTIGQLKVITRFISSVSGTFRSKKNLHQHIIFAGVRDGGYLAEKALQAWPRRGSSHSEFHIVAADTFVDDIDSLEYSYLEGIENRFEGKQNVNIYDRFGLAGQKGEEDEEVDDDHFNDIVKSFDNSNNIDTLTNNLPYPDLSKFVPEISKNEQGMKQEVIIPYLHVDGKHMKDQIEILTSAVPMLKTKRITSIGIEHSPDMNVMELIEFFDSVGYKTFFLGSRKLARIDNLCPETLSNILKHPMIEEDIKLKWSSKLLKKLLKVIEKERSSSIIQSTDVYNYKTPPFYIAFPRGRRNNDEMTIQHAYDLFGGWDGEKNVKTANDRLFTN